MTIDDVLEAWRVNNAVNLELLALCSDEDLELKPGKGKTIRSNYVHIIGFRRSWAEEKLKTEAAAIPKLDWKTATRDDLVKGLNVSHDLMADVFRKMEESTKPRRLTTVTYFAYCIAHEANHRSQVEIALRINDREPEDAALYRLWEWARK